MGRSDNCLVTPGASPAHGNAVPWTAAGRSSWWARFPISSWWLIETHRGQWDLGGYIHIDFLCKPMFNSRSAPAFPDVTQQLFSCPIRIELHKPGHFKRWFITQLCRYPVLVIRKQRDSMAFLVWNWVYHRVYPNFRTSRVALGRAPTPPAAAQFVVLNTNPWCREESWKFVLCARKKSATQNNTY